MKNNQHIEELLAKTGDMCLKRRAKLVLTELNPQKKDKILDIGCGDGFYLYLLSNLGELDITGVDPDEEALKNAKKQIGNAKVHLKKGDIYNLPFASNTFDKVVCSEVLEHLPDDLKGLKEIYRVMKKNGVLCITVPHWNFPFFWDPVNYLLQRLLKTHVKTGFWSGVWAFHLRLYRPQELKTVVKKAGFRIDRFEPVTHYGLPFNHYLTNIGFRIRTSSKVSKDVKASMSKFSKSKKKTWFNYVLDIINWLDKRNNKKFSEKISTVGLFVKAIK